MGTLVYGSVNRTIEIDDRDLAHLQFVITSKLRRSENFVLHCQEPNGLIRVLWLSSSIPLEFIYTCSSLPALNRRWLEALTASANQPSGLRLLPEPTDPLEQAMQLS